MITRSELESLVSWARSASRKVRVYFRGYKYVLTVSRYVEATDISGRAVPWATAFGSKAPHDVLSSFKIERVVLEEEGHTKTFNSIEELLKHAGIR
ncbi:MAG: hypothetical protein QXY49_04630 [Thermofilaceae archaeon]